MNNIVNYTIELCQKLLENPDLDQDQKDLLLEHYQSNIEQYREQIDQRCIQEDIFSSYTPLMIAAHYGYYEVGNILIDSGANPNIVETKYAGMTALEIALIRNNFDFVEGLFLGNELDQKQFGLLKSLVEHQDFNMVHFLLNSSPQHYISAIDNLDFITINSLFEFGVRINECERQIPIVEAARKGDLGLFEYVKSIYEASNISITQYDINGDNALIVAALNGHYQIVELVFDQFMQEGLLGQQNQYGQAIFDISQYQAQNHEDPKLRANFADLYNKLALLNNSSESHKLDRIVGSQKTATNISGENLLMIAAREGNMNIVGANIEQFSKESRLFDRNLDKKMALDIALDSGNSDMAAFIFYHCLKHALITNNNGNIKLLSQVQYKECLDNVDDQRLEQLLGILPYQSQKESLLKIFGDDRFYDIGSSSKRQTIKGSQSFMSSFGFGSRSQKVAPDTSTSSANNDTSKLFGDINSKMP